MRGIDTFRVVDGKVVEIHASYVPPAEAAEVARRVRSRLRLKRAVPPERLRSEELGHYLIDRWEEEVLAMDRRRRVPPTLRNTDGDELLLTTDRFEFDPDRRAAVEAGLASLEGVSPPEAGEEDPAYTFLREGKESIERRSRSRCPHRAAGGVGRSTDMCRTRDNVLHMSKMIQIRNVPEATHRALKTRAAQTGMTLSDYLLAEVGQLAELPSIEELTERIRRRAPARPRQSSAGVLRRHRDA